MAGTQRTLLLLLLFVGTMFLAISLASGADSYGCGNNCDCPNKQSCLSGGKCCWSGYKCKKVDFNYDPYNCGKCDYKCPSNYKCCYGKCVNVKYDNSNCGSCGNGCKYGKVCKNGYCK